jgi:hypothetical protein
MNIAVSSDHKFQMLMWIVKENKWAINTFCINVNNRLYLPYICVKNTLKIQKRLIKEDIQCNSPKKKDKSKYNDQQNITQETNDSTKRTSLKLGGDRN